MRRGLFSAALLLGAVCVLSGEALAARDAAFMDPGMGLGGKNSAEAVTVEPRSEIDTGESVISIAKRLTLFFSNQTNAPIEVVSVTTGNDGNVKSDIASDDCSKGGKIEPSSRCAVTVEVTPISPGAWTAEVLLTHSGPGRITKAKLSGKTIGQAQTEKKDAGLALSTKDIKPIDFGDVDANAMKAVRSALMVNDSAEPITLLSIDVIAADNGLERLDQGCAIDMELKAGESCPVTLVWQPTEKGQISTDLIIRHTGKLGFAVIPVRGHARGESLASLRAGKDDPGKGGKGNSTADQLAQVAAGKIPLLDADLLPMDVVGGEPSSGKSSGNKNSGNGTFHLIGTVGNRAVLLKPDDTTAVVDIGEDIPYGNDRIAKVTLVTAKTAEIFIDGKKKQLQLESAAVLTAKAVQKEKDAAKAKAKGGKGDMYGSQAPSSVAVPQGVAPTPNMGGYQ